LIPAAKAIERDCPAVVFRRGNALERLSACITTFDGDVPTNAVDASAAL